MKRIKSTTITYIDENGKETQQTTLRDTSRDCLADDPEAKDGIQVGNVVLFADGSYKYGKAIHPPAPLGGEYPLARPTAILRYWEAMHEELTIIFNNLKERLESAGHIFKVELGDGKTVDAMEQLESLKVSIKEAESQYHKAETALQTADPNYIPPEKSKLSYEQVKSEMDFKHKVREIELGQTTIKKPQRLSRR